MLSPTDTIRSIANWSRRKLRHRRDPRPELALFSCSDESPFMTDILLEARVMLAVVAVDAGANQLTQEGSAISLQGSATTVFSPRLPDCGG